MKIILESYGIALFDDHLSSTIIAGTDRNLFQFISFLANFSKKFKTSTTLTIAIACSLQVANPTPTTTKTQHYRHKHSKSERVIQLPWVIWWSGIVPMSVLTKVKKYGSIVALPFARLILIIPPSEFWQLLLVPWAIHMMEWFLGNGTGNKKYLRDEK